MDFALAVVFASVYCRAPGQLRQNPEEEAFEHLAEVSSEIFKVQLNGWYRAPSVSPEDRELNAFLRWFDCRFHSMVFDVCDERLRHTNT
jgi:hypothetical protein